MMKRILVVAALAISTLALSAPAHAIDPGTAMAMQMVGGLLKNVGHVNNRRPCYRPNIVINNRCVPPHMARRGFYPPTYLPPNIPGSPGYTGRYQHGAVVVQPQRPRVEHVTDPAKTHIAAFGVSNPPECVGKPPGTRYQRTVTEPGTGRIGRANYHC